MKDVLLEMVSSPALNGSPDFVRQLANQSNTGGPLTTLDNLQLAV
jgi:hypothetical protein